MKKIFLLILILLTIKSTLYSFNIHLIDPIKFALSNSYYTYKLTHYNYTQYIPLEDTLLTSIIQKKQPFDEHIQQIMTKDVYDTLYYKFKNYKKVEPILSIKIIDQRIDKNDPNLIYIDFLIIQPFKANNDSFFYYHFDLLNYRFTFDQIIVLQNNAQNWKCISYEQPVKYHADRVFFSYWNNLEYNYNNIINYQIINELTNFSIAYNHNDFLQTYTHLKNIANLIYNWYLYNSK